MPKPPPLRWIFQEIPAEKGIGMRKKMVLQYLMPPEIVGAPYQWVPVPIVQSEEESNDNAE